MREENFLSNINYVIDNYNKKLMIFYKDKVIHTKMLTINMQYGKETDALVNEIALETELDKDLIKGEL